VTDAQRRVVQSSFGAENDMTSTALHKRPLPPAYFLIALLAMALLHWLAPGPRLIASLWRLAGAVFIAIGVVVIVGSCGALYVASVRRVPLYFV
jgi:hypothetical protein